MGNTFAPKGFSVPVRLVIEEAQIVLHRAHQPHLVADLLDEVPRSGSHVRRVC
jgi:hypothetical protein